MQRTYLIACFTLLLGWSAVGQNLEYDIVRNGKTIGSLTVEKKIEEDKVTYTLVNSVEFRVLFSFNVLYELEEVFHGDILQSGKGSNSLNGSTQKRTSIEKNEDGYLLNLDGTPNQLDDQEISYSVSRIYHEEPFDGKPIYSQYFGRNLFIEKVGDKKYILKSPDGENEYTYKGGYCTKVKVSRDFATFYIKMNSTTLAMIDDK